MFRRARPRYRGRAGGRKALTRWTGDFSIAETTTAAGAIVYNDIVTTTDYEQTVTLEAAGPTLVRIRGSLSYRATIVGAIVTAGIFHHDDQINPTLGSVYDPTVFESFKEGELMWWFIDIAPIDTTRRIEIDVKAKRRLRDHNVTFVLRATAQGITWVYGGRALLRGSF